MSVPFYGRKGQPDDWQILYANKVILMQNPLVQRLANRFLDPKTWKTKSNIDYRFQLLQEAVNEPYKPIFNGW